MPRHLTAETILVETDSPELILARDGSGASYLALLAERTPSGGRFVCVAISSARLTDVCAGKIDLRDAFLRSENDEAFSGSYVEREGKSGIEISPLATIPDRWLPISGFPLYQFLPQEESLGTAADLTTQALSKGVSVGHVAFSPPESYPEPRISAYHLSNGLRLFQNLLRDSYDKAMMALSRASRQFFFETDGFEIQLLPQFAPGSFQVQFESKWQAADLSGETGVGLALRRIDALTDHIMEPEKALPALRESGADVVKSYQALLDFVITEKMPFSYEWSDPARPVPLRRYVGLDGAERMQKLIKTREELTATDIEFTGTFQKIAGHVEGGAWTLLTAERRVNGETLEGAGDLLAGVIYKTQLYRIICEERTDESVISRRPSKKYFLKAPPTPIDRE